MNFASIAVLCIVAGLLALSIVWRRKSREEDCGGSCGECSFPCSRRRQRPSGDGGRTA